MASANSRFYGFASLTGYGSVLINADDFGMSSDVNEAIVWAFQQGLISSASLMANMPGFKDACALTRSNALVGRIGVHLNLTEGIPLTRDIVEVEGFCQDGRLALRQRPVIKISGRGERAVEAELEAQIVACVASGVAPAHLDSHHHVHTAWPIGRIVLRLAERFGIGRVRLAENCRSAGLAKGSYKGIFNWVVRAKGLSKVSRFCGVSQAGIEVLAAPGGVEVMVHPRLSRERVAIDASSGLELEPLLRPLIAFGSEC